MMCHRAQLIFSLNLIPDSEARYPGWVSWCCWEKSLHRYPNVRVSYS